MLQTVIFLHSAYRSQDTPQLKGRILELYHDMISISGKKEGRIHRLCYTVLWLQTVRIENQYNSSTSFGDDTFLQFCHVQAQNYSSIAGHNSLELQ
jgi:hypothetical protein